LLHDFPQAKISNLARSALHNIGVVIVGFAVAFLGTALDALFSLHTFQSLASTTAGWLLLAIGFLIRLWATFLFYEQRMKVISLVP
jgi:hypothetical protein